MSNESSVKHGTHSSLYWRLWLRSLTVKRPQAVLAISSVLVGATVASMLLNLYGDARRKMTQEFRAYGPNMVLAPSDSGATAGRKLPNASPARANIFGTAAGVIDEQVMDRLAPFAQRGHAIAAVPVLYVVTQVRKAPGPTDSLQVQREEPENVVGVGTDFNALHRLYPSWQIEGSEGTSDGLACVVGAHIASRLRLGLGDSVELEPMSASAGRPEPARQSFRVSSIVSTGTSEDDQVFVPLPTLQRLAALTEKISLVELSVPGETAEVERAMGELRQAFSAMPNLELRPIRQIIYSAGKVLDTIRWVMLSLTGLILIIITLCVMATMTAIVLERRKDIAVMKSLGASDRLVMQLFLSEGAALGLAGGLAGFALGLALAHEMARQLFSVRLNLTWWTFPVVCFSSVLVAVLATVFTVELVHGIQPARVLRGE